MVGGLWSVVGGGWFCTTPKETSYSNLLPPKHHIDVFFTLFFIRLDDSIKIDKIKDQ